MPIRATSVTILCQSRLFFPLVGGVIGITGLFVTILCQSRLFFPPKAQAVKTLGYVRNHPLSIEAIFPT